MYPNFYADSLGYGQFMPMMNYYQMPYYFPMGNLAFQGNTQRQQATNSVIEEAKTTEAKKENTQYVGVDMDTGHIKGIKVFETTPEKIKEYQDKRDSKNTWQNITLWGTLIGSAALAVICGPKIWSKINPADAANWSTKDLRIMSACVSPAVALLPCLGADYAFDSSKKNLAKEYFQKPVDVQA